MSAALLNIKQIPIERVLSIEPKLEKDELEELVGDLDGFELSSPEDFGMALKVQRVGELTVRLTGYVWATFDYTCGRCLEGRQMEVEAELEYIVIPKPAWSEKFEGEEEVALSGEDLDMDYYEGEELDVRPFLREALVLELPSYSPCTVEDESTCDAAYAALVGEETSEQLEEAKVDLRWSKLAELKREMEKKD